MIKKIVFIVAYFGKLNNYFQLFLNSCKENAKQCDWLIFTDDQTDFLVPSNVQMIYLKWEQMQQIIYNRLDQSFVCSRPYKLCDYKPAYGILFADYIKNYEFWGHCDLDLIWGKFEDFPIFELLEKYDKVFDLGHCTIYHNTERVNQAFMLPLKTKIRYQEVLKKEENCSFDEEYSGSVNNILIEHGFSICTQSFAANLYTKSSDFRLTQMNEDKKTYSKEKRSDSVFIWNHGTLKRYIRIGKAIEEKEYLYIHFQSRTMKNRLESEEKPTIFKMIPNSFEQLEVDKITQKAFGEIRKKHFNLHYFRLRTHNLITKIKRNL